jgi:hypothetical protein
VVINAVNYAIVRQMAVASITYPPGTSEFVKSGLTPIPSDLVRPFRVKESPAHMECRVKDIITLGERGGAGHLIICDVLRMHIAKDVLDERNRIDPHKMDLMGRMGRAYYVRASGAAIHTIVQPFEQIGVGYDQLPESLRNSTILTGNNLGQLASLTSLPQKEDILEAINIDERIREILKKDNLRELLHLYAKELLDEHDQRDHAAKIALLADYL